MIDRRELMLAAGAAPLATLPVAAAGPRHAADLARYIGAGGKASGASGDASVGAWFEQEMRTAGFVPERLSFDAPFFEVRVAELRSDRAVARVIPQAIVIPTGPGGVAGRLVRVDPRPGMPLPDVRGAIALIDLPFKRWSSALTPMVKDPALAAARAGAVAIILLTNGPTGGAIALNAPADRPLFPVPTACLAPDDAAPFLKGCAGGAAARLTLDGAGGRRPAFNVTGRLDRGRGRWIVVSTPRSGWFTCAGERGPGVAVWLDLLRWAPAALPGFDLLFTANSGHEYENAGSEELVRRHAPAPAATALWLHLGAAVAARDWQEFQTPRPLPSADAQRLCVVTPAVAAQAKGAFAGLPGLESPVVTGAPGIGETGTIIAAGYTRTIGLLGAHRYHHLRDDDARMTDAALVAPVATACRALLRGLA